MEVENKNLVQAAVKQAYLIGSKSVADKEDKVKWWAFDAKGKRIEGSEHCYMGVMKALPEYDIHLRPTKDRNSCNDASLIAFLTLSQLEGLIVPTARIVNENGMIGLFIPRGHEHHRVYISLSVYRHSDLHGRCIVIPTLRLYQQLREHGVSFWQCLYFAMQRASVDGDFSGFRGHSFIALNDTPYARKSKADGGTATRMSPGLSISLWLKLEPELRAQVVARSSRCVTATVMEYLQKRLKKVPMQDLTEILSPENNHRFQNPMKLLEKPLLPEEKTCPATTSP